MSTKTISEDIIALIVRHLDGQGSDRSVAKKAHISNTAIGNFRTGASMKLDTMEKILNAYPELRRPIAQILLGENTDEKAEKHTAAPFNEEAAVNEEYEEILKDLRHFREVNKSQAETILQLSRVIANQ